MDHLYHQSLPIIEEALSEHSSVKLTNERGDVLALIGSNRSRKVRVYEIPLFLSLNLAPEEDYVKSLYDCFGFSEKMYVAQRSKATSLSPASEKFALKTLMLGEL